MNKKFDHEQKFYKIWRMLKSAILSFATIFSPAINSDFFEAKIEIPAGISELKIEKKFNAVAIFSEKKMPKIFYQNSRGNFLEWEIENEKNKNISELLFLESGKKIILRSEKKFRATAHFFDTKIRGENLVARFDPFDDDLQESDNPILGLFSKFNVAKPKYISRADWGADEKIRQKKIPKSEKIKKIIIHHTGEYVNETREPAEIMRAIYHFHTITRDWGDIGYNYVIDSQGNIYEGRAGGPTAIGAHIFNRNPETIGISLMGNFQHEEPTAAQLKILTILLADQTRRFEINPLGNSEFFGKKIPNIVGHGDAAENGHPTACPGKNLRKKLHDIRKAVSKITFFLKKEEKEKVRKKGADFLMHSAAAPQVQKFKKFSLPEKKEIILLAEKIERKILHRDEKSIFEIKIKNNSDFVWPAGSKILAKNAPDGILISPFRAIDAIRPEKTGIFRQKNSKYCRTRRCR